MSFLKFSGIQVKGISACVPKLKVDNFEIGKDLLDADNLRKTIQSIGIKERHIADQSVCSSDLCFHSASKLIEELNTDRSTIDLVLFVSQTPDYRLPATACHLQEKLSLTKNAAAFDINLGCSGYIYGLACGFAFLSNPFFRKVLLLVGDTPTKFTSNRDKSSALLFGDAGTATLIEKTDKNIDSYFSLNTDGSGVNALKINAGGYRLPSSTESLIVKQAEDQNFRNEEQIFLDGSEIFTFTIREVPKDIKNLLSFAGEQIDNTRFLILHQANKYIIDYLAKKLNYPSDKLLSTLQNFGNTSSASIPLTIVNNLHSTKEKKDKILLSGFGVGLSWGSSLLNLEDCLITDLFYL